MAFSKHSKLQIHIHCVAAWPALNTSRQTAVLGVVISYLHSVHGLPQLVKLMSRAEGFQANISQLHLLVSQLIAQLHDRFSFAVSAFRNSGED